MLDESPGLVHHADLQFRGLSGVLDTVDDSMENVEQQRLEQRRIRAHRLEVEDLEPFDGERVLDVVEEAGVAAVADPLVHTPGQGARQQVREREQAALTAIKDVQVLDRLVDLPILQLADPVSVFTFEQHPHECMKEMQVFGRWLEGKGVDRDVVLPQADFEIFPAEQRRQLAVAVTDVEDDGLRRVLLGVRNQEVQQKALAASRRSKDEGVADVLNVEVERVRRPVGSLERRRAPPVADGDSPASP